MKLIDKDALLRKLLEIPGVGSNSVAIEEILHFSEVKNNDKGCTYCNNGLVLNDTTNSEFKINLNVEEHEATISVEYDFEDGCDYGYSNYINYCPMCGRKF